MKAQRFKAILPTGNWPDNPEPLMRSETGEYVKYSDLVEALRQRDEARQEATDLDAPACYPPVTVHVDLCLRMMIRAAFDYKRNRKVSEIIELLTEWFTDEEIEQARDLAGKGVIPPITDLEFYKDNV